MASSGTRRPPRPGSLWNSLPNRRRARFFNLWAGRRRRRRFQRELRADLEHVLLLARDGTIAAPVARRFPLSQTAAALSFAERRGLTGKVVIVPGDQVGAASPRPRASRSRL